MLVEKSPTKSVFKYLRILETLRRKPVSRFLASERNDPLLIAFL